MQKHTHECALNKFIQEHQSDTRLRIEDVRTLITADSITICTIKTEPKEDTENPVHMVKDLTSKHKKSELQQVPLLMVTAAAKEVLTNPDPTDEPLLVVTTGLTLDQPGLTEFHSTSTRWSHLLNRPVPVSPNDTSDSQQIAISNQPVFPEPEIEISDIPSTSYRTDLTHNETVQANQEKKAHVDAVHEYSTIPQLALQTESTTHGNNPDNTQGSTVTMEAADSSRGKNPVTDTSTTMRGNKSDMGKSQETSQPSVMTDFNCDLALQTLAPKYYKIYIYQARTK